MRSIVYPDLLSWRSNELKFVAERYQMELVFINQCIVDVIEQCVCETGVAVVACESPEREGEIVNVLTI